MGRQKEDGEKKDRTALLLQERKKIIYNLVMVMTASFVVLIGMLTMAWFALNKDTSSGGMGVKSTATLFELKTSGSTGLYDAYITDVDSDYSTSSETGGNNGQKIIWQLSSQSQMENLWSGIGSPTAEDMRKIQKYESDNYGLSPGDYGQLTFTIVPKTTS